MKKVLFLLCAALGFGSATQVSAQSLKIGTVDMKAVFESYHKTKEAEQRINEARNQYKKEMEDRLDSMKKLGDDINKLHDDANKSELSKEAKEQKSKQYDDKVAEFKNMQRENQEFQTQRERQLQEQGLRMRQGIVDEIMKVVNDRAKSEQYDLIFDRSGPSLNGVSVVLYAKESYDFTSDVIKDLNKRSASTDTSAAGDTTSGAAAATPAKAGAATPKKK